MSQLFFEAKGFGHSNFEIFKGFIVDPDHPLRLGNLEINFGENDTVSIDNDTHTLSQLVKDKANHYDEEAHFKEREEKSKNPDFVEIRDVIYSKQGSKQYLKILPNSVMHKTAILNTSKGKVHPETFEQDLINLGYQRVEFIETNSNQKVRVFSFLEGSIIENNVKISLLFL